MLHVKGKEIVDFAMDRLEKSRSKNSILYLKAEEKKRSIIDALSGVKVAEEGYNVAEQAFEESVIETGFWRAVSNENGVCTFVFPDTHSSD